jgi:hypothetical protein
MRWLLIVMHALALAMVAGGVPVGNGSTTFQGFGFVIARPTNSLGRGAAYFEPAETGK